MAEEKDAQSNEVKEIEKWMKFVEKLQKYRDTNKFDKLFIFDEARALDSYFSRELDEESKEELVKTFIHIFGNYCKSFQVCATFDRIGVGESLKSLVEIITSLDMAYSIMLQFVGNRYNVADVYQDMLLAYDFIFTRHRGIIRIYGDEFLSEENQQN